jgi:hypothetical protein
VYLFVKRKMMGKIHMAEGILSDEKKAEIRQKKINWSGLAAGGSISKDLADKISSYSPEKFKGVCIVSI